MSTSFAIQANSFSSLSVSRCGMNGWITKPILKATIAEEVNAGKEFLEREGSSTPPRIQSLQVAT